MRSNKRRFEKILAAGLALGSLQGNLAGAANVKKPVSYSSSNKGVIDKIWSNKITKGALLTTAAVVGGKTLFDIGKGIYGAFKNKDVKDIKNTEPGYVDFEKAKISDLRGSNIVVHDGKILMSCDIDDNKNLDFKDADFKKILVMTKLLYAHDGTRNQFLSAEEEISKWYLAHNKREVLIFKYKNVDNFKRGREERKIYYLLDAENENAYDATDENKIGLSNNTVFRVKGEDFGFKINAQGIAKLETKVFAKKMLSKHLGNGLELQENDIEIIPDDQKADTKQISDYKKLVIKKFAKPNENKQLDISFIKIPNENLVICYNN